MQTVLVIDDNTEVRENTAELLQLAGYRVETAINGKKGYEQVLKHNPDVIVCDIMMPETDGLGFLKLVKSDSKTGDIPLIFFSAGSAPPAVRKKLMQGADLYLPKPFTEDDLLGAIALVSNHHA